MKYFLDNITKKQIATLGGKWVMEADWKDMANEVGHASIWEDQKDGSKFPGFHGLKDGDSVEGNLWTNDKGKQTIYPPKGQNSPNKGGYSVGAVKAVEMKQKSIEKSQDRKEEGIMVSSTASMANNIVIAQGIEGKSDKDIASSILKWRYWWIKNWDNLEQKTVGNSDIAYPDEDPNLIPF